MRAWRSVHGGSRGSRTQPGGGPPGNDSQGALREGTTETEWSELKFPFWRLCLIGKLVLEWWHVLVGAALVCLGRPWLNWVDLISSALYPIKLSYLQALFWKETGQLQRN